MIPLAVLVAVGLAAAWVLGSRPVRVPPWDGVARAPRASVVIPARNEAARLPHLMRSLAALEAAPHQVLVVDDASTDSTAELARAAGATVVQPPDLPPGWVGKPWACHHGARQASGDLLVFLDADVRLAPDGLERVLAAHDAHGGLLSVQPHHDVAAAYEQLSAAANVVPLLASAACARTGSDPARSTLAFGPCLATSRRAYDAAGGHAAIAGQLVDDVALAAAYRATGQPVHVLLGADAVTFRMYPEGLGQLVEGWTKNLAVGASAAPVGPLLGAVAWVAAGLAIAVAAARLVLSGGSGADLAVVAGAWALYAGQLRVLLRRVGSFSAWTAILFPVPLIAFAAFVATSTLRVRIRRQVPWRGRMVRAS